MNIHIFATNPSRWDIFLPQSTTFHILCGLIHKQTQTVAHTIDHLYIYVGVGCYIHSFDLPENFDILLVHSPIERVHLIVDSANPQFEHLDRAVRFMHTVYGYAVCLTATQTQPSYPPLDTI